MKNAKIAVVLAVVCMLSLAYQQGIFAQLSTPELVKERLTALGGWGYLAFIVSYAALQPFGVPGTIFIWAAPFVWPWYIAFALSLIGTQAASVVGFSFARFIGRDWVASKIPERFKQYDEALAKRAFVTVFLLRLIFWMPPPLHAFFGLSAVSFSTHFWGSLLGYLIPLLLVSLYGPALMDVMLSLPWWAWLLALIAVVVGWLVWRKKSA